MTPVQTKTPAGPRSTSTATLLYWLLVICGLAGITMQRLDAIDEVLPIWVGTIAGLGLGQLVAWARIRAWVIAALGMTGLWLSPVFFIVFYRGVGGPAETMAYALVPAGICGYLSLSERGALLAFWYPAVLWMLVILDGPASTTFDTRTALPLVIGLTALFVAFLRAKETRRVALWRGHAAVRLAAPLSHAVLRASPLRAASQHAWTGLAGAAALVLAAWIAPQLWQTEKTKQTTAAALARGGDPSATNATGTPQRCCSQAAMLDTKRVRVREYFPLLHGHDEEQGLSASSSSRPSCTVCQDGEPEWASLGGDYAGLGDGTSAGSTNTSPPSYRYGGAGPTMMGAPPSPMYPSDEPPPVSPWTRPTTPSAPNADAPTPPPVVTPTPKTPPTRFDAEPAASAVARRTSRPGEAAPEVILLASGAPPAPLSVPPWKTVLVVSAGALALRALVRALRRKLTLRHLARPFWAETLDQRISNHWERVLIGLRDAGIHATDDEQPEALAKRVGIEGMDTCATILERVRHGVRVDAEDLAAMDTAAGAVFRAAQAKAGVTGRAAALVRWPLA
jgi:hypothetical protein